MRETSPLMWSRTAVAALAAIPLLASLAAAQLSPADDGRTRLRDRYEKPRQQQKLDDAIRKFGDEDVPTRLEGIEGLGQSADDPKAIQYLMQGASDPEACVQAKSIDVIGDNKVKEATPLLVQQLFMRDTSLPTKQRILAALGKIGDPRATKPILDFLARDIDPTVRGNAIYALGDIGDKTAIPPLEKLAKNTTDDTLRGLAQSAIRKIQEKPGPAVVPPSLTKDRGAGAGEDEERGGR
jgi:HEAT repeat protein